MTERDPVTAPPAETLILQLHRCKVCGTAWLLWPDAVHGGGWNLLDKYQRPGVCCDNVAMGEQIEHLRDIPLEVRAEPPPVPPAAELTRRVVHAETLGIEQADRILALEAALQTAEQQLTYWKTCALEAEAHLQIAEQARDEWHHEQKETEKALIALQARFDEAIHAYEQAKATLTQIRALPRSHRASTYEHLGRYEAGPFVRADELDRLLNALPETPKKSD